MYLRLYIIISFLKNINCVISMKNYGENSRGRGEESWIKVIISDGFSSC